MVKHLPQGTQPNLWRHFTRFDFDHLVEKSPSASYPPTGIGASFWWRDALPNQPARIREETLESGNLFSGSWISAFVPLYIDIRCKKNLTKKSSMHDIHYDSCSKFHGRITLNGFNCAAQMIRMHCSDDQQALLRWSTCTSQMINMHCSDDQNALLRWSTCTSQMINMHCSDDQNALLRWSTCTTQLIRMPCSDFILFPK